MYTYNSHAHANFVVCARTLNLERQRLTERAACSEGGKLLRFLVVIFDMRPIKKGCLCQSSSSSSSSNFPASSFQRRSSSQPAADPLIAACRLGTVYKAALVLCARTHAAAAAAASASAAVRFIKGICMYSDHNLQKRLLEVPLVFIDSLLMRRIISWPCELASPVSERASRDSE